MSDLFGEDYYSSYYCCYYYYYLIFCEACCYREIRLLKSDCYPVKFNPASNVKNLNNSTIALLHVSFTSQKFEKCHQALFL